MIDFNDLKKIKFPTRSPDLEDCGDLYWFEEMIVSKQRSDLSRELALLAECPVSHELMYTDGYYPLGWSIVNSKMVQKFYKEVQNKQFEEIVLV